MGKQYFGGWCVETRSILACQVAGLMLVSLLAIGTFILTYRLNPDILSFLIPPAGILPAFVIFLLLLIVEERTGTRYPDWLPLARILLIPGFAACMLHLLLLTLPESVRDFVLEGPGGLVVLLVALAGVALVLSESRGTGGKRPSAPMLALRVVRFALAAFFSLFLWFAMQIILAVMWDVLPSPFWQFALLMATAIVLLAALVYVHARFEALTPRGSPFSFRPAFRFLALVGIGLLIVEPSLAWFLWSSWGREKLLVEIVPVEDSVRVGEETFLTVRVTSLRYSGRVVATIEYVDRIQGVHEDLMFLHPTEYLHVTRNQTVERTWHIGWITMDNEEDFWLGEPVPVHIQARVSLGRGLKVTSNVATVTILATER